MLILSAVRHAVVEEVIVVGYLLDRFGKFGWSVPLSIFASSMLRGSYHLYQGFGPFIGNAIMGVVFAWVYTKTRRVMPPGHSPCTAGHCGVRRLQPVRKGRRAGLGLKVIRPPSVGDVVGTR